MISRPRIFQSSDDGALNAGVRSKARIQGRSDVREARESASPHAARFRTVTAILVGLAIAAVAVAATIAVNGRPASGPAAKWAPWSPSDGGTVGAREIADYVAPFYRISPVDQLAVVTVVNLETPAVAAAAQAAAASGATTPQSSGLEVAVRPSPTSSAVSLLTGNTIAYNLCGIGGKNCAIGVGQPSQNRLLLLRREALELALYTFKYISGTESVVAILPPGRTQVTSTLSKSLPTSDTSSTSRPLDMAVLFQRQELQPLLNQPLSTTLPEPIPPTVPEMTTAPEAGLVSQVTARGLFSERLQQAQDGTSLIVLDPLPPQ
ncbi:MAG TPA: hypothetical protein VG365_17100 [Solirubrobacteraceae bacterium]|jgi:hypothetical protein|nr:hypothetical protein [Solirubrobacteraceae bacterium]